MNPSNVPRPGVPRIEPVPEGVPRPRWSVMIPCYNASPLLEATLRGVLAQDPGPESLQLALVDDRSPGWELARDLGEKLAPGRIEFHRNEVNLGLAGNWNRCLEQSRGERVHVLHQDDLVLPGFYHALDRAFAAPEQPAAAFTQHVTIDKDGLWEKLSHLERRTAGVLPQEWGVGLSQYPRIQCPSIAVRRSVYEDLGGFDPGLKYALDWEMWLRIATRMPIWFEPTVLACYRLHPDNETARLQARGDDMADIRKAVAIMREYVPEDRRHAVGGGMWGILRDGLLRDAATRMQAGDVSGGLAKLHAAIRCDPKLRFSRTRLSYYLWTAKLRLRGRKETP